MASKNVSIRGVLRSVTSQRVQYKPYGYELCFDGDYGGTKVLVELSISKERIVEQGNRGDQEFVVLDLEGLNVLLEVTADSVDKIDQNYKKRLGV